MLRLFARYLVHGLIFTGAGAGSGIFLAYMYPLYGSLASRIGGLAGSFLGFILGFGSLLISVFFLMGALNVFLLRKWWYDVRWAPLASFIHGMGLFLVLLPVTLIVLVANHTIDLVDLSGFVDYLIVALIEVGLMAPEGYACVWAAERWKVRQPVQPMEESYTIHVDPDNPGGLHCPRCRGTNLVVAQDKSAFCIDCQRGILSESLLHTLA